jgi:signal transduction histidine kinase
MSKALQPDSPTLPPTPTEQLISAVQELSMARDLETIMAIVRRAARALTGADGATFVLRDGECCYYAEESAIAPLWKGRRFPLSACISGWAMLNRRSVAIEDIYADPRIPADAYRPTFVKSLAMVPIRTAAPIGAIGNYWASRHLVSPEEVKLLQALADSTSIAMENVQLYAELEQRVAERTAQLEEANQKLKEAQAHLVHSEKMISLGQLVAGIAHEINNPIAFVANNLFTSREGLERLARQTGLEGAPAERLARIRRQLEEAGEGARRVAELVAKLRAFSRLDQGQFKTADLHESLDTALLFLRHRMKERIQVEKRYGPQETLYCTGEFNQVLLNVIANAVDAIEGEGKITLTTGQRDGMRFISVQDTGRGIPREIRERIFDPFFTTKPVGQGTGLGLSIAHSIVQAHQGRIEVRSEEGKGTEVAIEIPLDLEARINEPAAD